MGFTWCIRRSASSLASVCGRVTQARSIATAVNRSSLARNPSPLRPFVHCGFLYSTVAERPSYEQTLLRVIESQIKSADEIDDVVEDTTPGGFPFKIEDNPGHQTVTLTREFNGEQIEVEVNMPSLDNEEDMDDDDDDDDDGHGPSERSNESSIPLVVTVTKKSGLSLEFSCVAFSDEIAIDGLSVHHPDNSLEDQMANEGPDFEDLDENLKKTFHKYLEIRGIKASTTNFLHEYMMRKQRREYLQWLKNVKKFMEE